MCLALSEKLLFAALSSKRDTRGTEDTRARTHASARAHEPMAHCLSHQSARFMRGLNEVIRLAAAINILVAGLTTLPPSPAAHRYV